MNTTTSRDDVMRLAEEAGIAPNTILHWEAAFLRFATLLLHQGWPTRLINEPEKQARYAIQRCITLLRVTGDKMGAGKDPYAGLMWHDDADTLEKYLTTLPSTAIPMTRPEIHEAVRDAHIAFCLGKHSSFEVALIRTVEKHFGVGS